MSKIDKSKIATFALLILPIVLSCSKSAVPFEMRKNTSVSTEVIESIRRDLGMLDSHTLEVLDFEAIPPRGGWNGTEIATILKSTDDKFQIASVSREPESTHSHRWSISCISILLIDGGGETVVLEREYDHRPTTEDVDGFKKWLEEW